MIDVTEDGCFRLRRKLGAATGYALAIAAALSAAISGRMAAAAATLDRAPYGTTQGGQAVDIFAMTNENALRIDYAASTDKDTVVNLTNHSYFNLASNGSGSVADKLLLVNADRYTPTGPDQIPTGEIAQVEGTPLDFRQMMPIGACVTMPTKRPSRRWYAPGLGLRK